ncbi:MAG: hypothetical protein J6Y03_03205 [Alphaproteobacteria bacterium]|nr:hypothetical protein [Alphaproteobacteria bacterium]
MKKKIYYYHFNRIDECFWAMMIALVGAITCCCSCGCLIVWGLFIITALLWMYKNVLKQKAVVITDKDIKIDHSKPLAWKDIKDAEIKTVRMCGGQMKVLSLNPKNGIKYSYNWLQKHNANFGPFPIPLYGILTEEDEKEILQIVKKQVKVK